MPDDLCYNALIFLLKISSRNMSLKVLAEKNALLDKLFPGGRGKVEKMMNKVKDMAAKDKAPLHVYATDRCCTWGNLQAPKQVN